MIKDVPDINVGKMDDWITRARKKLGYKGCRNCKKQISPLRMCEWAENRTEAELHVICPNWERKDEEE